MTLKRIRSAILSISFLVLAGGVGYWIGQHEINLKWKNLRPEILVVNKAVPPEHRDIDFSLFWDVWGKLEKEYLDSSAINPENMVWGAISGMTASLNDPYTYFLPPEDQKESKDELAGTFEGVGIQLGYKDNRLAVIAPLDGMPAQKAGIKAGDYIVYIKDENKKIEKSTEGLALPEAVAIIRGPKGSVVSLTIQRQSDKPFAVDLKRDTIIVKSVALEFIDSPDYQSAIAYVRLSRFGDDTVTEWNRAVEKIVKQRNSRNSTAGMILDVRSNPGGYLDAAVAIAGDFFRDGSVVEQKGKTQSHPYLVKKPGRLVEIPLVVLVDKGSASASEIVAGAIKARKRGKLIGTNSFGKGTVQDAQELSGGAGLHITTARWLLPDGSWIQDEGLRPDIEVEYNEEESKDQQWDNQVKKAIEILVSS